MTETGGVNVVVIEDPSDPRVADYRDLRDPATRRRERDESVVIVEGLIAIGRLLESEHRLRSLLVAAPQLHRLDELDLPPGTTVYTVPQPVIERVAGFKLHRVALAAAERRPLASLTTVLANCRRIAVIEGLNDIENLGAIARSARALGIDAMVLDPRCADPYYRRTVRVSMGEILLLPVARAADWPADLQRIAAAGFETWALTPSDDADDIWTRPVPERVALLLGAEGPGLSQETLAAATHRVRIPLHRSDGSGADSLNVGHAATAAFAILTRP